MAGPEAVSSGDSLGVRKAPPNSIEAEEALLGSALLSRDASNRLMEAVKPRDFYSPNNEKIFDAMKELFDSGKPIDSVTVSEIVFKGKNTTSLNASYIARLVENVPSSANFERYIEIVLEHSNRRKLLKASGRIELLAYALDKDISSVMDESEQSIFNASDDAIGDGLIGVSDFLNEAIEQIEEIENQGTGLSGLATHFVDLDNTLAGLQDGNLIIIAARPSMGKSSLALNIATNAAKESKTVAFFSLEMTKEELVQRVLFSEAKVASGDARKGQLGPEKWSRVVEAASKVNTMPLYFDDASVSTVTDIRAKSRRLKASKSLDLIVVDYIQLMQGNSGDNRQQEIAEISRNLKGLARELKVPIIALSQLNRAAEAREDKRPRLGDLRESGAIEQDADIVMMIYRDDYYNPATEKPGVAEINIVKNRSGSTGKVDLYFSKEYTQFTNYSKQSG
ncbi:replicative DNA helicase [Acidimicrobiia bacterium]|jgi:replicative DNA helicase|nr:replicative DNA helicase [Acidimicrobiia bacterium]MDA9275903.1 replicative DNA helicase [Acidimicrobiia bacterium]MDB4249702.1 replicative DNA helicase [Acidimicrobiia bacterium]MDC1070774.1 replicative DNA helicase [Acidimicrobiia bacterium]|tara:strand:+ start:747 stop:2102 length:1356 start_codon:yes stop_codon:yes gene_type:complete